ncbi:hypothetical protein [uncultured Caulobacter sp.]|uniref:hypothetical protein n=1 Tax=uncultured Caulobacter sp. TaxID=158749 RepID=UPI00262AF6EC|nr:hypothetical protein [uncultured Caulobacter sp.]
MTDHDREQDKPDTADTPPHLQTEDQKGAGPINDAGSGVSQEDGGEDPDNMGRA